MAFLGFSMSLIIGLYVNNEFVTTVLRSLVVLVVFYILGCLFSFIGQKAIQENFENEVKRKQQEEQEQQSQQEQQEIDMEQSPQRPLEAQASEPAAAQTGPAG